MRNLPLYILIALVAFVVVGGLLVQFNGQDPDQGSNNFGTSDSQGGEDLSEHLKNFGPAPEFAGISRWLNSEPLTMQGLRGKVVLVDFWTYSCINCIRTLPHVTRWHNDYNDDGLVVVGVHTPEFEFEKSTGNVETAIRRHKIGYPVAQDNDFATWRAYNNHYWPAKYLVDQDGNVVYSHFGEGEYELTESLIRKLLGLDGPAAQSSQQPGRGGVKTPEIYFGLSRLEYFQGSPDPSQDAKAHQYPSRLGQNRFSVQGNWRFSDEYAELAQGSGRVRLNFTAGKVHMVAEADAEVAVKVFVDGREVQRLSVRASQLYTLFDSEDYREHELELEFSSPGFRIFTFTFG